ncbi:hypothetical protein ODZ84_08035 [Chryseobacterium fluminis]|nr:hypothetical protein [Chryseobacterium sp. MMS21-Ot14]UZT99501.1 hypothetical protein ODZ84_08035 [Chryseobacterium sp. MMS21-Ot14]
MKILLLLPFAFGLVTCNAQNKEVSTDNRQMNEPDRLVHQQR